MNILWVSNSPFAPSGYGQQTAITSRILKSLGHKVGIFANHRPSWDTADSFEGIPIAQSSTPDRDAYRGLALTAHLQQTDLIIVLADAWVLLNPFYAPEFTHLPDNAVLAIYSPVDSKPFSPLDAKFYDFADVALMMSPHGLEMVKDLGYKHVYMPHSIDREVYDIDRPPTPPGTFCVGMVHQNYGTRKLIPLQLRALSKAASEIPDLRVLMHTDLSGAGSQFAIDYRPLVRRYDLRRNLKSTFRAKSVSREELAELYNQMDILLHTTAGEGFGLPIVEAAACGVPAVVTRNSSPQHFSWTIKVEPVVEEYGPHHQSDFSWPSPEGICEALVRFYHGHRPKPEDVRAATDCFDIEYVKRHHWAPFLNQVEVGIFKKD